MELTNEQVFFVEEKLRATGLRRGPVKEELFDHLCCAVEESMVKGAPFHAAVQTVFDTFLEDEMQEIEKHSTPLLHQKQLFMKKMSLALLCGLLATLTLTFALTPDPPSMPPITGEMEITSGFGMRQHPLSLEKKHHKGIDFKAPLGTPVVATADGVVLKVESDPDGYGNYVVIRHDQHFQTLYAQLSEVKVQAGQEVSRGTTIGAVGSSGRSTGPHLHYEIRKDGNPENPAGYLRP